MVEVSEFDWKQGLLLIIGTLFFFDFIFLFINLTKRSGPGGCSDNNLGGWYTIGPLTMYLKNDCESSKGKCDNLGKWKKYATNKDAKKLCSNEIDKVWKDAVEQNIVDGYNMTQLLAYVIVPTITVLGIAYGLLATNMNKSEWTFWIMIATIMATGVTSIAYDTDVAALPTQQNPLESVTSNLKLGTADELEFSFISRKQDGDECLIKGTVYGEAATKVAGEPITYSGDCVKKDFL